MSKLLRFLIIAMAVAPLVMEIGERAKDFMELLNGLQIVE